MIKFSNLFLALVTNNRSEINDETNLAGPSAIYRKNSESDESDPFAYSSSSYEPYANSEESDDEVSTKVAKSRKHKLPTNSTESNEKLQIKRSRRANRAVWARSISKNSRLSGKKYVNRSGKEVQEKKPKIVDCTKCRFKCNKNIPESHRATLCQEYYSLANDIRQKILLTSLMQKVPVVRVRNSPKTKNRQTSTLYFLKDSNGKPHRVCLKFFCATFAISHRVIENCAHNMSDSGLYIGDDKRKNTRPPNTTSDEAKRFVKEHIDSFPRVESHYCRRDSQKQYISPELNISIMYRLYAKEYCAQKKIQPVSRFVYQKIFHDQEPRLAFYIPKKDQCFHCNAYQNATEKTTLQEEYDKHKQREKQALEMKEADKKKSVEDNGKSFRSISFDLQAILSIPHAGDNQIYYKHKLNVYNFTIYDAFNSDGYCFVWDETHGNKGSAEIGSCILDYLFNLPETVNHVASFSDTCGGQNRNKYVAAAMLFAVNKIDHLKTIDLKFMESGHSYLEADSMHATIERAKRHKKIYSTREWCLLIETARIKPRQYRVKNFKYCNFFNLQQLVSDIVVNTTHNINKDKVNWLNIKWLRFQEEKPFIIQYKYSLADETFLQLDVADKRRPGRKKNWSSVSLNKKYESRLPVSQKKKKDLLFLLEKQIIPEEYKSFIQEIPETARPTNDDSDD